MSPETLARSQVTPTTNPVTQRKEDTEGSSSTGPGRASAKASRLVQQRAGRVSGSTLHDPNVLQRRAGRDRCPSSLPIPAVPPSSPHAGARGHERAPCQVTALWQGSSPHSVTRHRARHQPPATSPVPSRAQQRPVPTQHRAPRHRPRGGNLGVRQPRGTEAAAAQRRAKAHPHTPPIATQP